MPWKAIGSHAMTILACGSLELKERTDSSRTIFWKGVQVFLSKSKESKSLYIDVDNWPRAMRHPQSQRHLHQVPVDEWTTQPSAADAKIFERSSQNQFQMKR
jgi:hypothetical protein